MKSTNRAVVLLRIFLGLLFLLLVVFQFMSLPGQFAHMAKESPDLAHLRWPLTAITVFWVLCAQAVVVSTWKLLTLVKHDRIFNGGAMRWVDVIVGAVGGAWLTLLAMFLFVGFRANDPSGPLIFLFLLTGLTVFGLLIIVMRSLLLQATTLRRDMEEVI